MNGPIILHQLVHPSLLIGGGGGGRGGGVGRSWRLQRWLKGELSHKNAIFTTIWQPRDDLVLLDALKCPLDYVAFPKTQQHTDASNVIKHSSLY